jgi:hypothetical protein
VSLYIINRLWQDNFFIPFLSFPYRVRIWWPEFMRWNGTTCQLSIKRPSSISLQCRWEIFTSLINFHFWISIHSLMYWIYYLPNTLQKLLQFFSDLQ